MALVQSELVHRQVTDGRPVRLDNTGLQARLVDRLDRVPAQVEERGHRLHAGGAERLLARIGNSLRDPLVAPEAIELLQPWPAAALALHPASRHMQNHPVHEQRQIPNPAHRRIMHLLAARTTLFAVHDLPHLPQDPRQRAPIPLRPLHPLQSIALPVPQCLERLRSSTPPPNGMSSRTSAW